MLKKKSNKLIAIILSVLMSGLIPAAVTLADNLVVDGDNLTPVASNDLNFGEVIPGELKSKDVLLAISRQGGGNAFLSASSITVALQSSNSASIEATMSDSTIETPGNWSVAGNGAMTSLNASSRVTLDVPLNAAAGTYTAILTYQALGNELNNKGIVVPLTRTADLEVTYKVIKPSDTTPPTANHSVSTTSWTNGDVEINVTAEDSGSGLKSITDPSGAIVTGPTATYTATTNGNFTFILEDNAGNTSDYTVAVNNIDKVNPTAAHLLDPETWTNGNVKITVIGDDDASGVESISILNSDSSMTLLALIDGTTDKSKKAEYTVSENGNYVFFVNDSAGNSFEHRVTVSNIDTVSPTATHLLDPDSWTNGNVKITVMGDDDASGVKSISLLDENKLETPLTLLDGATVKSKQAEHTVSENGNYVFLIKDNAGNSSEYPVEVGIIDRNAPTITIGGTVYTGGETVNLGYIALDFEKSIAYTTTDDLSGFAPAGVLSLTDLEIVDTSIEGMNLSQVLTVTDQAGNSTSITFTYHVISMEALVRLLRPVEMDPSLNIFKKGSTVPIKLQLLDEQGMPSQMSASDLNFVLRQVSGAGTIGTKVKPSPIASFRLSNDGYTYIYNLSTKNLTIGKHVLSIDLESGNGSVGEIGFALR